MIQLSQLSQLGGECTGLGGAERHLMPRGWPAPASVLAENILELTCVRVGGTNMSTSGLDDALLRRSLCWTQHVLQTELAERMSPVVTGPSNRTLNLHLWDLYTLYLNPGPTTQTPNPEP